MSEKELNVSNPVLDSLKKIDDNIASLSTKIEKLRSEGNDLGVKDLVSEGKSFLRDHYRKDYQNEFLAKQKEEIANEKIGYKEKKAKLLEVKKTDEFNKKIAEEKENLVAENERYKKELASFVSSIDYKKIEKANEKGLAELAKAKEEYNSQLASLKAELKSKEVLDAKTKGAAQSLKEKEKFKVELAKLKEEHSKALLKIKSETSPDELKKKAKEENDAFTIKKNRLIVSLNAKLKAIRIEQEAPKERILNSIRKVQTEYKVNVKNIKDEKNAPVVANRREKHLIHLLHKKRVNDIKTEINRPKAELRKKLDDLFSNHQKKLSTLREGSLNSFVHKDDLTKQLTDNRLNIFARTQTWCRGVMYRTPNFFEKFGHNAANDVVDLPKNSKKFLFSLPNKKGFNSISSSIVSILVGLLVGFVIMIFFVVFNKSANPIQGLGLIFAGPFSGTGVSRKLGDMIFNAVPIIFTGLSVAIAFKTGLFNIGAPGQYLMGIMGALMVALNINTIGNRFAGVMVWLLALVVAVIFAAIWALIPGFLKAQFGINEVIISIMTNWIAANLFTWVFQYGFTGLHDTRQGHDKSHLIPTELTGNYTPHWNMGKSSHSVIDISIFIAIIFAILLWVMMNKTTLGYSLKACGYNRNAAKYAGINEKLNIMIAMGIAGGLAGLGGAFKYLNQAGDMNYMSVYMTLPAEGFNGIPVALLASSNPIGVIFTSVFIRYIFASNLKPAGFNNYIGDIVIATIIYLAGFSRFFSEIIVKIKKSVTIRKENSKAEVMLREELLTKKEEKGAK